MKQYEPYTITLQWNGEMCRDCENSLSKGERVWAQAHQFNRRSFWCMIHGNIRFETKSDPTEGGSFGESEEPEEEPTINEVYCKKHPREKIPCVICNKKQKPTGGGIIDKVKEVFDGTDDSDELKDISTEQWPSIASIEYAMEKIEEYTKHKELEKCKMELTKKGLLNQFQGAFAVIYKGIDDKKQDCAFRLFTRRNTKAMDRYNKLSNYFDEKKIFDSNYFTKFEYIPRAVEIFINTKDTENKKTKDFPIIKMGWVNGDSLENFIQKTNSKDEIKKLSENFLDMVNTLENLKIAHGDLHPKNILVDDKLNLRLVDYDCIYIPNVFTNEQPENGDADCQHPHRSSFDYDEKLDRFSALVIYLGLLAMSENIDIKYHKDSKEFPFSKTDFLNPTSSELFLKLENEKMSSNVRFLTKKLSHYCKSNKPKISSLKELLNELKHNEEEENGRK